LSSRKQYIYKEIPLKRPLLILFIWTFISFSASATHLMGGDFTYKYLYTSGGNYFYKIRIDMFRDCQNSTTEFDYSISVGVYLNNLSRSQLRVETLFKGTETLITPPSGGSKCSWVPPICIKHTYYEGVISLPPSTVGFHLVHVRCCRNNLVNFIANTGQTYYAFIPPNIDANNNPIYNSSPYFGSVPTPYICAQDTVSISYSATDIDGDSLVYELAHPWAGGSDQDPIPVNPMNLSLPVVKGTYSSGYSLSKPFGNSGYCTLNQNTGLITLMVPSAGFWAVAVDVKEYRNGQLLSVVRRDIELIVLNCPPNNFPKLVDPIITTFIVEEGNTLAFNIAYTDKDTMKMVKEGDIFGGSGSTVSPPYATLTIPPESPDSIKTKFEWKTSCEHGRSNPYFFTIRVTDKGCPAKTTVSIFQIYVQPFKGPDSIDGPTNVCEFDDSVKYIGAGTSKTSLISWNMDGGSILTTQGKQDIKVKFDKASGKQAMIELYETSKYGCGPVRKVKMVNVHPLPIVDAGNNISICSGDTITLGTIPQDTLAKYTWSTSKNLSDSNIARPKFSVKNISGSPIIYTFYLTVKNLNKCINTDSIIIVVNPEPDTFSVKGNLRPCFAGTFTYQVKNNPGSLYYWQVKGGKQVSGGNSYKIDIIWTDTFSGEVGVYEVNKYGCLGDTQFLPVQIVRPGGKIYGPEVVCPNTVNVEYWVNDRVGSKYYWYVINGKRADGNHQKSTVKINWPDSGLALIKMVEVTQEGCISDTSYLPVLISYHLKTPPIEGDTFVCEFNAEKYQVMNVNGSNYSWQISGGMIQSGNGLNMINCSWGTKGLGLLKVLETSYDSVNDKYCYGDTVYQSVLINPIPHTSPIIGDTHLCEYDTAYYSVSGFVGSAFYWSLNDTSIAFIGQGNNKIQIFWQKEGTFVIKVWELTKDSCTSNPVLLTVSIHPNPKTSKIYGPAFVCYPNNKGILYNVQGFNGSTYQWSVDGGQFPTTSNLDHINVNWHTSTTGSLQVIETTEWGCIGKPVNHAVKVDSLAPAMELVTTMPDNSKIIETQWKLLNDVHFNKKIYLYRNEESKRSWMLLDSFVKTQLSFIDNLVNTENISYYYKISAENLCGNIFESYPHRSIVLKGIKTSEFDVYLHWNNYINWSDGVEKYNIYRKTDNEKEYKLATSVEDTAINMDAALKGFKQCYRVAAVKNFDANIMSWSNETCFVFEPVVQIPNAFTPNGDGLNDFFEVKAANIHTFHLEIYNEWGQLLFSSDSAANSWDGTFNGRKCPMDVYVVVIRYQGNSSPKRYTGTITLIR